ncbi:hypothetical protein [Reinekea sp.]|jgi:hypothetical protein|uniref:hypothetical protein n=1 Tax=Reinekea sp. TaxID=1970455 RepID=UPI003989177C
MQKVPIDKILIQPTVQYRWLEQNGSIEFSLPTEVLEKIASLWQLYLEALPTNPSDFLQTSNVASFELFNDDLLFALFTGASYALTRTEAFQLTIKDTQMLWSINL